MKAIVYQAFGNADVLQMAELPKPAIESREVLIKVKAFSINPMDGKIRKGEMKLMSGWKFPKYTGADFSGIVEEVGGSVAQSASLPVVGTAALAAIEKMGALIQTQTFWSMALPAVSA